MRPRTAGAAAFAGPVAVFTLLGWLLARAIGLEGTSTWIFKLSFVLLGVLTGFLLAWYVRARRSGREPEAESTADDEIDSLWAEARRRLAGAPSAPEDRFGRLPLVFVLGLPGSAKTTVVVRGGPDPDLLAGAVGAGDTAEPTRTLNVWYGGGTVFLEAAHAVVADEKRWSRLLRWARPDRMAAALGTGAQAPRIALVCVSAADLIAASGGSGLREAARELRAQLARAGEVLGIELPVYVLFTQADRVGYFQDYFRNLSWDEAQEVLGVTLPLALAGRERAYAESEAHRVRAAFDRMIHSLALRRSELLGREPRLDIRSGLYEFPRELAKLRDRVSEFLVELGRPSHLGVSPFLRGFYFTGVRPVVVESGDRAQRAAAPVLPQSSPAATTVFDARALQSSQAAPVGGPSRERRIPQWVGLSRFFREVILADPAATALTAGGHRVNLVRRAVLTLVAGAAVFAAFMLTVSYGRNRALQRDVVAAARDLAAMPVGAGGTPTYPELAELDTLRAQIARIREYERDGRPWSLGFGLYRGRALLPEARRIYFASFEELLGRDARRSLITRLARIPEAERGSTSYQEGYDGLRTHLVTTSAPERSSPEFVTPVLLNSWSGDRELDPQVRDVVAAQFDLYATELPEGNPIPGAAADAELVDRMRRFLRSSSDEDRYYRAVVDEVSRETEPFDFDRTYRSGRIVRQPHVVAGAYTPEGWAKVHDRLERISELLSYEDWVTGDPARAPENLEALADELRTRYVADYRGQWQAFLDSAQVPPFADAEDAARRLEMLGDAESVLLRLIAVTSTATAVDSARFFAAFQPAQLVVPASSERLVNQWTDPYLRALGGVASTLATAATQRGPAREMALNQASQEARRARDAMGQLAVEYDIAAEAQRVRRAVQSLLEAPIRQAERVIGALPALELNEKASELCRQFSAVTSGYPFTADASRQVTVDEVAGLLRPGESTLWDFHRENLTGLIAERGSRYRAVVGASPVPNPGFVQFFDRAAAVSLALFPEGASTPEVLFALALRPTAAVPRITVTIGGRSQSFDRTATALVPFTWRPGDAVRVDAALDGGTVTVIEASGTWGLFRVFDTARWSQESSGRDRVTWSLGTLPEDLVGTVTFTDAERPVLRRDFIGGLRCVSTIAG